LKTCLHYDKGTDLKALLRGKQDDFVLEQAIRQAIYDKPKSHNFNGNDQHGTYEQGHMSKIGG
jgi:cyclic pyranopterin phosphate synthase